MKKRIAAVMLIVVLIVSMTACSGEEEKLVGTWTGDIDFAPVYNASLGSAEEMQYLTVDSLVFRMVLTFTDGGTYTMTVDEASLHSAMDGLKAELTEGMARYLTDLLAEAAPKLSLDDYLEQTGTTLETLVDSVVSPEMIADMAGLMVTSGRFRVDEGKLYMSDSPDIPIDKDIYEIYAQDGDYLTLVGTNVNDKITDLLYPMVFTRAE